MGNHNETGLPTVAKTIGKKTKHLTPAVAAVARSIGCISSTHGGAGAIMTLSPKPVPTAALSVGIFSWLKIRIAEIRSNPDAAKIWIIRSSLVIFLIIAAVMTTITAYDRLMDYEYQLYQSGFESVSRNALHAVSISCYSIDNGIQSLSNTYGHMFPRAEDWPSVAWQGFQPSTIALQNATSIQGMAIVPIVQPEQVLEYAQFIADYYPTDPYCNPENYFRLGVPPGRVWYDDPMKVTTEPILDNFGNLTSSPNRILAPLSQYTFSQLASRGAVGYNIHANALYTDSIDDIIDCVGRHEGTFPSHECSAISRTTSVPYPTSDVPEPEITDMVAVYMVPIIPARNQTQLVGIAAGAVSWKELLTDVVSSDISGIDCVVSDETGSFTFAFEKGQPILKGRGDHHDRTFNHLLSKSRSVLKDHNTHSGGYRITFYSTKKFEQSFRSIRPLQSALVMLGIFLFCSTLFGVYDILMHREFDRNQAVLNTKRRFVRFISHEIRTPLNTVGLGMKLLEVEMCRLSDRMVSVSPADLPSLVKASIATWKTLMDEIVESSESAVEVLNDLLNYDKIEVGNLKLDFGYFSIVDSVDKITASMQVQALQKNITLYMDCRWSRGTTEVLPFSSSDGLGGEGDDEGSDGGDEGRGSVLRVSDDDRTVVGDGLRVGQVLRNLISNALKFTPHGGEVTITVSAVNDIEPLPERVRVSCPLFINLQQAGTVRIAVKDSGAGLTPRQISNICAEGVQFNANELQAGQGSGLGLFISKGILEQHGGRLSVASEGVGKGVTFTVELPLFRYGPKNKHELRSRTSFHESASALSSPCPSGREVCSTSGVEDSGAHSEPVVCPPRRLLVVDDSLLSRKMLVRLLQAQGHVCVEAENGESAIVRYNELVARGEAPDAILMDFEMPVMNGPTATARLREMGCACLIVGVTGNVLPEQVTMYEEKGADCVLAKPVAIERVTEALMRGRSLAHASAPRRSHREKPLSARERAGSFGAFIGASSQVHPFDIV